MKVNFGKLTLIETLTLSLIISILIMTSYSAFTKAPVLRDPYAVWLFYGKRIMETKTIPLYYGNAPDISWSGNYPPLISFFASYYFIGLDQAVPAAFTHVSWVYGCLTLLVTFMLARELGLEKFALMSTFLLTTASLFTLELVNFGYVTIAWTFYITASCFYLVKYAHEKTLYAWLSFGLSLGAALLSTYLSLIFAALLLILFLATVFIVKIRRKRLNLEVKPLIIGFIVAFIIMLPWLLRNYVLLQNPIYPWLYDLFGGRGINVYLIRKVPQPKYNLLILLTDNTFLGYANEDIGYTLLVFGLAGSLYLIWRRKETSAHLGWLTLMSFTFFIIFMNLYYGYERYLLMIAPLLATSAGHLLDKVLSSKKVGLRILAIISIIIFSMPNYSCLVFFAVYGAPLGEAHSSGYIEKYIDNYLPQNAVILTNEISLYYINRQTISIYNLLDVFQAKNLKELIKSFKIQNITHVLINSQIDAEVLEDTPLITAITLHTNIFEVLLNMPPYTLYNIKYEEVVGYG